jgi:transducin (beta)-like 1
VHRTSIDPNLVPAGALVAFIQKGMQYMEMEANIEARGGGVLEGAGMRQLGWGRGVGGAACAVAIQNALPRVLLSAATPQGFPPRRGAAALASRPPPTRAPLAAAPTRTAWWRATSRCCRRGTS